MFDEIDERYEYEPRLDVVPFCPQLPRSFKCESQVFAFCMKFSWEIVQPNDAAGKYPHLLVIGRTEESAASARSENWAIYFPA